MEFLKTEMWNRFYEQVNGHFNDQQQSTYDLNYLEDLWEKTY